MGCALWGPTWAGDARRGGREPDGLRVGENERLAREANGLNAWCHAGCARGEGIGRSEPCGLCGREVCDITGRVTHDGGCPRFYPLRFASLLPRPTCGDAAARD